MTERVDRTERLLNLVICLMATSTAVPRADIRARIPGYSDAASDTAFERMFERDKDELRSMGIPVDTVTDVSGEEIGYRIVEDSYALQAIDFTLEERAAIAVAAQVWSRAAIAPVAGTALRKLESLDGGTADWAPADLRGPVQLTASDAALLPLMSAVRHDKVVTFDYRTPVQAEAQRRTVSPWGLRSASGRWILVGFDHDRDAQRTFRLSRIEGSVTVTAKSREHQPPEGFDIGANPTDGYADEAIQATLRIAPHRGAALRRLAVATADTDPFEADTVTVSARSIDDLVSLVCGAGADVVVLDPPEVVDAVVAALAALRRAHGAAS
ncbi:MAG: WYL domain-containing protein [bacterium]|nr:WYL domain-containing protein [bacterium]